MPAVQQPQWPDTGELERALKQISTFPPLVFAGEARSLQAALGQVASGNAFLLQAGDCAESFEEFTAVNIREKLRVILQMAVMLTYSMGVPVVKVGRIAGQFAKPRSANTEKVGNITMLFLIVSLTEEIYVQYSLFRFWFCCFSLFCVISLLY